MYVYAHGREREGEREREREGEREREKEKGRASVCVKMYRGDSCAALPLDRDRENDIFYLMGTQCRRNNTTSLSTTTYPLRMVIASSQLHE